MSGLARAVLVGALWIAVFVLPRAPGFANDAATASSVPVVGLELVAEGLIDPVSVRQLPDGTNRRFVVEKIGRIRIVERGELLDQSSLDMTATTISASPEQGMDDLAFHPGFVENGLVYISHTERYLAGALVV